MKYKDEYSRNIYDQDFGGDRQFQQIRLRIKAKFLRINEFWEDASHLKLIGLRVSFPEVVDYITCKMEMKMLNRLFLFLFRFPSLHTHEMQVWFETVEDAAKDFQSELMHCTRSRRSCSDCEKSQILLCFNEMRLNQ